MSWIVVWLLFAIVAGIIADTKARHGAGWFLLGLIIGPFALVVAALPSKRADPDKQAQAVARETGLSDEYRKCPFCAEAMRREASVCRFCRNELPALPAPARDDGSAPSAFTPQEGIKWLVAILAIVFVIALFKGG